MNAEIVKRLWERRMSVIHDLQAQAFVAEGREPTAEEKQAEERMTNELVELDGKIKQGLDDMEREARSMEAFERYQQLTGGNKQPSPGRTALQEQTEGLRKFLNGETRMWETEIDPRVSMFYNIQKRSWDPAVWERRDLLESTPVPIPTTFSGQLYETLVASVAVLSAKSNTDTLFLTASGEPLVVPRATAYGNAAWIGEGVLITEADPAVGSITLNAYGDKALLDISAELVQDEGFDLLGFVARVMGRNAGLLAGAGYVTGDGSSKPTGFQPNATVSVTGPTGTTVSLGTQATVGQGTDLLVDLVYSVIAPYRANRAAWIMNDATVGKVARLKGSNGEAIWQPGVIAGAPDTLLGYPIYTDPNMPVMAANAKSIAFGDWNGYAVRVVRGVRFERSDHAKFENDLISFKAVLRTDGKLIDTSAIKLFQNSAT